MAEDAQLDLIVLAGPAAGRRATIGPTGELRVGRAPGIALQIAADNALSRQHFSLVYHRGLFLLEDLGSANGTSLNGDTVRGQQTVHDGDTIEAGQSRFQVQVELGNPDASVLDPESDLARYPGYTILEPLGEGNMGAIYLVESAADGERYALKCLRPDADVADTDVQRFLREAQSMRSLAHRNIVGFIDEGFVGGEFFFVMEFVEGVDLDLYRRQAGGRIPPRRAVELLAELLDGLDYAHRQGFVHRDVKPANILVGIEQGRMVPKLTDFGLAKKYEEVAIQPITRGKIAFGTPDYMPPEQVTRFRDVGPKSDIYSAAATLYHLISGETVYAGIGTDDPIRTLIDHSPMPLSERAPWLPGDVTAAIQRGLSRTISDRWNTAGAFREALLAARDASL